MALEKTTKSTRFQGALAVGLIRFLSLLPLSFARALGAVVGRLAWRLTPRRRAASELNLRFCFPDMPDAERLEILRRSFVEGARTAAEFGAMWFWSRERLAALEEGVEGVEILEEAIDQGRGVVLLVPHLGNWEMFNHFLTARYPLTALYRPPRIEDLDGVLRRARERSGVEMIPTSHGGMRRTLGALRNGRILFVMPDQEPLKSSGVFAPFFHVPALTMTLASRLLQKTGATPVFGYAERRPSGKFLVRFMRSPEGIGDPDPVRGATMLNRGLETCIRGCPEQYQWDYKRFRTRPSGEPTPYRRELRDSPEGGLLYRRFWPASTSEE